MDLVWPREGRFEDFAVEVRGSFLRHGADLAFQPRQHFRQSGLVGQRLVLDPLCCRRKCSHRAHSLVFPLRDDGKEIAVAHDLNHARHRFDPRGIDLRQRCIVARRPNDAGMHHPFESQILHIGDTAGDLGRNIDTRQ